MGALYMMTFPSGKSYIGITSKTVPERIKQHIKHKRAERNNAVHRAIRKYGETSFSVKTLIIADDWDFLCEMEKKAISVFETLLPIGYNITRGGDGTLGFRRIKSDAEREKISGSGKKRKYPPVSDETRKKLSAARLGKKRSPCSEETKQKMSRKLKGRKHPISEETKAKISAANKGKKKPPFSLEHREKLSIASKRKRKPWSAERRAAYELRYL